MDDEYDEIPIYDIATVRKHPMWRAARAVVLTRDDHCYLCGEYVDKTIRAGELLAPEVDHIYPLALGGHPWSLDNLALTHRLCNNFKHDKTLAQLGQYGITVCKKGVAQAKAEYVSYDFDFATMFDSNDSEEEEDFDDDE